MLVFNVASVFIKDHPVPCLPPTSARSAYSQKKIQENVQCEIMHCIVEEATDSYRCGDEGWGPGSLEGRTGVRGGGERR